MSEPGIWYCKIGNRAPLVKASDWNMRQAIAQAFREVTGFEPDFIFSGWNAELEERELAVVENREPR